MKSNTSSIIVLAAILNTVTAVEPSSDPIEICTAEYRPVDCGQLIPFLFDNICIAEKAGFDPERCHEISIEPRMCSMIHEPVFCTSPPESEYRNEYSNLCLALEAGFDRNNCGPDFSTDPVEPSMCITLQEPVFCSSTSETKDRHEFSNLCFALEAGFNSDNCGPDFSTDPVERDLSVDPIDPDEECITLHEPVFCSSTSETKDRHEFSNLCFALEAGFNSDNCGPDFSTDPVERDLSVDPIDPDEECITLHEPVFCSSTSETKDRHEFSNLCFALEAGFNSDNCGPDFSTAPVERDLSVDPIDPDEECITLHEPVFCSSTSETKDRHEFSNLCFALEAGFNSDNCGPDFSTDPVERDLSVDPIDPDEECTLEYAPVVCDGFHESTTFPNLCAAEKAGFDSNKCTLKTGGLRGQKPTM